MLQLIILALAVPPAILALGYLIWHFWPLVHSTTVSPNKLDEYKAIQQCLAAGFCPAPGPLTSRSKRPH